MLFRNSLSTCLVSIEVLGVLSQLSTHTTTPINCVITGDCDLPVVGFLTEMANGAIYLGENLSDCHGLDASPSVKPSNLSKG